jgi:hypoxanthine phosphoribosyltransferase
LIPARIIARHLKIDRIYCVGAKAYSGIESNEELKVYQGLPSISSMSVIIVDDISDRGNTLDEIKTLCKCICPTGANIVTAAPYFKTGTSHIPNFSIKEFDKDNWVVFPWEDDPEDV